jgi:hypothetical protein
MGAALYIGDASPDDAGEPKSAPPTRSPGQTEETLPREVMIAIVPSTGRKNARSPTRYAS